MDSLPAITVMLVILLIFLARHYLKERSLKTIPVLGSNNPFLTYADAILWVYNSKAVLERGYRKFKPGVFRVATLDGWLVVVAGPQYIEELRKAPDTTLSFTEGFSYLLEMDYTLGSDPKTLLYHSHWARSEISRNIRHLFNELCDEIAIVCEELIPASNEWIPLKTSTFVQTLVVRSSNRTFAGTTICRNKDYVQEIIASATIIGISAAVIRQFPQFMKPIIGPMLPWASRSMRRLINHLEPVVEERRSLLKSQPQVKDEAKDFLQYMIEQGAPSTLCIAQHMAALNIAAVHATSQTITHAIYRLARSRELAAILREEVEEVIRAEGWTYDATEKMRKTDSFIKEVQRADGVGLALMQRYSLQPFTFSNGVHIPKGTALACVAQAMHDDEEFTEGTSEFNPWRYLVEDDYEWEFKTRLGATSPSYIVFGVGRHTCPGRFFAASEMKAAVAHILLNYDIQFADEGVDTRPITFDIASIPRDVEVQFRRRVACVKAEMR